VAANRFSDRPVPDSVIGWTHQGRAPGGSGPAPGRVQRVRTKRRYHFHAPLGIYVFVTLLIALGAFNSQNNLLFWAFGFSLAVLLVSGFISGHMMMRVSVNRQPLTRGVAGEPLRLRYRVSNRSRWLPAFALTLTEDPPSERDPGPHATLSGRALGFVVHAGPRSVAWAAAGPTPRTRGRLHLTGVTAETSFPFGIIRKSVWMQQPAALIVRPEAVDVDPTLIWRGLGGQSGESPRRARLGGSEDFFALREYLPGDPPRSIAWRASARSDSMLVRQHAMPAPHRLVVVLRLEPDDPEPARERAIAVGAAYVRLGIEAGFEVGLLVPALGLERPPRRGPRHLELLLDDLSVLDAAKLRPGAVAPARIAGRRSALLGVHAGPIRPDFLPADAAHVSATAESRSAAARGPTPGGPRPRRPLFSAPRGGA